MATSLTLRRDNLARIRTTVMATGRESNLRTRVWWFSTPDARDGWYSMVDLLDRKLVHGLQVNGRAPFRSLAAVIGVSDQTVARRYNQLRSAGLVAVRGLIEPGRAGRIQWIVRVRALPATAAKVADALALRPDTSWVSLTTSGGEVLCIVDAPGQLDHPAPWMTAVPAGSGVVSVDAFCILHEFFGGKASLIAKHRALSASQVNALRPIPTSTASPCSPLNAHDGPLLDALKRDGRTTVASLSATTGWSQSAVRRRVADLVSGGVLYFDVDFAPALLDLPVRAVVWLQVPFDRLTATGEALAEHPEVAYVAATTGVTNLYCAVLCQSATAFYSYLTERIAALGDVQHVETAVIRRAAKTKGNATGDPATQQGPDRSCGREDGNSTHDPETRSARLLASGERR